MESELLEGKSYPTSYGRQVDLSFGGRKPDTSISSSSALYRKQTTQLSKKNTGLLKKMETQRVDIATTMD